MNTKNILVQLCITFAILVVMALVVIRMPAVLRTNSIVVFTLVVCAVSYCVVLSVIISAIRRRMREKR